GGNHYREVGEPGLANVLYTLLVIGGLNTVLSVYYYIRVIKVTILDMPLEEVEGRPSPPLGVPTPSVAFAGLLAAALLVVGVLWGPLSSASDRGVERFRPEPPSTRPLAQLSREGRP